MGRTLIWIEKPQFRGWGCSDCTWLFNPTGPPTADSLEEMKQEYVRERDADFAAHACANSAKPTKTPRT